MRCALCNHPLLYPEIYIDLLPVGPRCARRAGLVELAAKAIGLELHWAVDTLGQKLVASEQGNHLNFSDGVERIDIPDACLKPIRDNDSKDETLKWAPVPVKEAAC